MYLRLHSYHLPSSVVSVQALVGICAWYRFRKVGYLQLTETLYGRRPNSSSNINTSNSDSAHARSEPNETKRDSQG